LANPLDGMSHGLSDLIQTQLMSLPEADKNQPLCRNFPMCMKYNHLTGLSIKLL
jgi:hypothetical protein